MQNIKAIKPLLCAISAHDWNKLSMTVSNSHIDIVIKYYFATQNNILCVIGYEISKEFIPI